MTTITLMERWQNPKGRRLVQEDNKIKLLSECCDTEIHPDVEKFIVCKRCGKQLQESTAWATVLEHIESWAGYSPTGIVGWGQDMLGLEDFMIRVDES